MEEEKKLSVNEISVIAESVRQNLGTIQSKLTNAVTNRRKNEIWEEIAKEVNAVGHAGKPHCPRNYT